MLCQICKKKEATVHYTKIVNGQIEELHICDECAKGNVELGLDSTFSFHKLLTGLIDGFKEEVENQDLEENKCPFCGLSYEEFRKTGKFGCPQCYDSFKMHLTPLFKGIHGHSRHRGKLSRGADKAIAREREIDRLRAELESLVSQEAFEKAAILRDKIKGLEKELGTSREGQE